MTFDKAKWIEAVKKAVADKKTAKASSNVVCAIASIRFIRDNFSEDNLGKSPEDKAISECVFAELNELIQDIQKNEFAGFASNASQAAKTAGFKSEAATSEVLIG